MCVLHAHIREENIELDFGYIILICVDMKQTNHIDIILCGKAVQKDPE